MRDKNGICKVLLCFFVLLLPGFVVLPGPVSAQEEVASAMHRYKGYEASTGYYEEYEVLPRRQSPFVEIPGVKRGLFSYSPTSAQVRIRTRLADSHLGIKFYNRRRCEDCHIQEAKDIHTSMANLTCRQCHGGEPIASIIEKPKLIHQVPSREFGRRVRCDGEVQGVIARRCGLSCVCGVLPRWPRIGKRRPGDPRLLRNGEPASSNQARFDTRH